MQGSLGLRLNGLTGKDRSPNEKNWARLWKRRRTGDGNFGKFSEVVSNELCRQAKEIRAMEPDGTFVPEPGNPSCRICGTFESEHEVANNLHEF
jgi:hypothetical protein